MKKAISLLSGGLDSVVSTALAQKRYEICLALTFDYGHKAAVKEIQAAKGISEKMGIPHKVIELPWLGNITTTALVNKNIQTPAAYDRDSVWVPNRNALFANIAASFAENMKADYIIAGLNAEEGETFPDNSIEFVHQINKMFQHSTLTGVELKSFTQNLRKIQIVERFISLGFQPHEVWSCYNGGEKPCGKCESCLRSIAAFIQLGVTKV